MTRLLPTLSRIYLKFGSYSSLIVRMLTISDNQLTAVVNSLGALMIVMIVAYHYIQVNAK